MRGPSRQCRKNNPTCDHVSDEVLSDSSEASESEVDAWTRDNLQHGLRTTNIGDNNIVCTWPSNTGFCCTTSEILYRESPQQRIWSTRRQSLEQCTLCIWRHELWTCSTSQERVLSKQRSKSQLRPQSQH